MSESNEKYHQIFQNVTETLLQIDTLCRDLLCKFEPVVKDAMAKGVQDLDYLYRITAPLYSIVLACETGQEVYNEYLSYLETFAPVEAKVQRDLIYSNHGMYNDLVAQAASMAKAYHYKQTDKQGVDYFDGHLTTVGQAGSNWKEKIVGYLHDTAEMTHHSVDEIIQTLKQRSKGILKENDAKEIAAALRLLNSRTANSREAYIAQLKDSSLAIRVKLSDLEHNMDISRIKNPTTKDKDRINRYRKEYRQILEYLGPVIWEWDDDVV